MTTETITYDINDPADARTYVATFAPRVLGKQATYMQTSLRTIHFDAMTDEDACQVARWLRALGRWLLALETAGRARDT